MLSFAAGLLVVLAAVLSPIATVALHYHSPAHLLQNVMLAEWAPALLVLGISAPLAAWLAPAPRLPTLTYPLVALPLWIAFYAAWHIPAAVRHDPGARNTPQSPAPVVRRRLPALVAGLPGRPHGISNGARALYVFAAFLFASPLGLLLALLPSAIYDFYDEALRLWGSTR